MLTKDQADRILDSVQRLTCPAAGLTDAFYKILFDQAPETRVLFGDDISIQSEKLLDLLMTALHGLHNVEALSPALRDLGRLHAEFGVTERHYPIVGKALITALAAKVGDWSDEDQTAWAALYGFIAQSMIDGARQPSDKGETAA